MREVSVNIIAIKIVAMHYMKWYILQNVLATSTPLVNVLLPREWLYARSAHTFEHTHSFGHFSGMTDYLSDLAYERKQSSSMRGSSGVGRGEKKSQNCNRKAHIYTLKNVNVVDRITVHKGSSTKNWFQPGLRIRIVVHPLAHSCIFGVRNEHGRFLWCVRRFLGNAADQRS